MSGKMDLIEATELVQEKFPKGKFISNLEHIKQNGLYLYFDGVLENNTSTDKARFMVLVAGNSLSGDAGAISELKIIRKSIFDISVGAGKNCFKGIKAASFEGSSMFIYAISIEIEVKI